MNKFKTITAAKLPDESVGTTGGGNGKAAVSNGGFRESRGVRPYA